MKYAKEKTKKRYRRRKYRRKIEIAIKLKKLDFLDKEIAEITEMPVEKIKKL